MARAVTADHPAGKWKRPLIALRSLQVRVRPAWVHLLQLLLQLCGRSLKYERSDHMSVNPHRAVQGISCSWIQGWQTPCCVCSGRQVLSSCRARLASGDPLTLSQTHTLQTTTTHTNSLLVYKHVVHAQTAHALRPPGLATASSEAR